MTRPTDWHNLDLDSDPTPGDVHEIRAQGRRFQTFADDVATVHSLLNNASKDQTLEEWNGKAADAFRGQIGKLPGQLSKLHESYGAAGDALVTFARSVELEQSTADGALAKARILRGDLSQKQAELGRAKNSATQASTAKSKLDSSASGASTNVPPPDPEQVRQATRNAQQASAHQSQVAGQVAGIQAQLAELRTKAETAGENHGKAVEVLDRQLDDASNAGIHNKKWYQKLADALTELWHWTVIAAQIVVAIGGIALLFLSGPLALFVLAAALIVLADTIVKFSQGKAGWGDLLFAALDCIPVAGKLAMLAKMNRYKMPWMANRIIKFERAFQKVIKVWRTGQDYTGFKQFAFTFGKGLGKDTLKDSLNGGWNEAQNNFVANLAGNAIGSGTGPLLDKGFAKIPRLINSGNLSTLSTTERRSLGHMTMTFNGQTFGGNLVMGTTKGLVTAVTKETVNSAVFGAGFDITNVGIGAATGVGDSGVGYAPGVSSVPRTDR